MELRKKTNVSESGAAVTSDAAGIGGGVADDHTPRNLTFAENVILTIKVLVVLGLIGAALWGISLWTFAK
jgi:hypothetical protein